MKASRILALALLVVTGSSIRGRDGVIAAPPDPGPSPAHHIAVEFSQVGELSTWRYTIAKTDPDAKDLGHFIVNLASCGDQSPTATDIVSATVNGVDWSAYLQTSDGGGTGCEITSANFVKFDDLPAA